MTDSPLANFRDRRPTKAQIAAFGDNLEAQFELEKWWVERQGEREAAKVRDLKEAGKPMTLKRLRHAVAQAAEEMAFDIDTAIAEFANCRAVPYQVQALTHITKSIDAFDLAYLAISTLVSGVILSKTNRFVTHSAMAQMASNIKEELILRSIYTIDPELDKVVNKLTTDSRASVTHRKRLAVLLFHKRNNFKMPSVMVSSQWTDRLTSSLLATAFGCASVCKLMTLDHAYDPLTKKSRLMVRATPDLLQLVSEDPMELAGLMARYQRFGIFVSPPPPRSISHVDFLLTASTPPFVASAAKGKNVSMLCDAITQSEGYPVMLQALDYLQSVPYRINKGMLAWVRENYQDLVNRGIFPSAELKLPPQVVDPSIPKEELSEEQRVKLAEWKAATEKAHNKYHKGIRHAVSTNAKLQLADKLSTYSEFYYQWYCDFRGRMYPVSFLSPQTDSLGKALIEFAEGVEIKPNDYTDKAWLEFVECGMRLWPEYAKESTEIITNTAKRLNPMELRVILKAAIDKIKPKDYLVAQSWLQEHFRLTTTLHVGGTARTNFPIRKDATCSSIQHMAAMSGDLDVMKATNCVSPSHSGDGGVQDLYTMVLPNYKELGLERDWIKQQVMTAAYNSTDWTRIKQINKDFEDKYGTPMPYSDRVAANDTIKQAALVKLGKVTKLQHYLMEAYKAVVVRGGFPAWSITPAGLIIDSSKYTYPRKNIELISLKGRPTKSSRKFDDGKSFRCKVKNFDAEDPPMDKVSTRRGWVANIIHSLDACLLQMTFAVFSKRRKGSPHIFPIHDCVVTRPGEMGWTLEALNHALSAMYAPAIGTGLSQAMDGLVKFWQLDTADKELYDEIVNTLPAQPASVTRDLKYFFV